MFGVAKESKFERLNHLRFLAGFNQCLHLGHAAGNLDDRSGAHEVQRLQTADQRIIGSKCFPRHGQPCRVIKFTHATILGRGTNARGMSDVTNHHVLGNIHAPRIEERAHVIGGAAALGAHRACVGAAVSFRVGISQNKQRLSGNRPCVNGPEHAFSELARLHNHQCCDAVRKLVSGGVNRHHISLLPKLLDHYRRSLLHHRVARISTAFERHAAQQTQLRLRRAADRGNCTKQFVLQKWLILWREVGQRLLAIGGSAHNQAKRQRSATAINGQGGQTRCTCFIFRFAERLWVDESNFQIAVGTLPEFFQILAHPLPVRANQRLILGTLLCPEVIDAHRLIKCCQGAINTFTGAVQPVLRQISAQERHGDVDHRVQRYYAH